VHPLRIGFIFVSHLFSLAFAIYSTRTSGVQVEVLLYAFIVDYLLRLWTIQSIYVEMRNRHQSWIAAVAPFISRRPAPHETSQPVRDGENGPPARIGTYLIVMAVLSAFAFMLANVGADRELHVDPLDTVDAVSWAIAIGAVYWVNSLLNRVIVIDVRQTLAQNLGYNTREVTVLAMAVLTAGLIVAIRQNMDLGSTGWTVMGPLLGYRFLYELWASLEAVPEPKTNI
jgi:hypothetical protein